MLWNMMNLNFETFWNFLKLSEMWWQFLKLSEMWWNIMKPNFLRHSETFWNFLKLSETYWNSGNCGATTSLMFLFNVGSLPGSLIVHARHACVQAIFPRRPATGYYLAFLHDENTYFFMIEACLNKLILPFTENDSMTGNCECSLWTILSQIDQ